jgi:hypothetical protein
MALDWIGAQRNVCFETSRSVAQTCTELPAIVDYSVVELRVVARWLARTQARYQQQEASRRVHRLVQRQIRMMCMEVPGRAGHARWLARELAAIKALRDAQ